MVLKYPFVTEKAMVLLENQSKLQFLVSREATKNQIKREIEKSFGQERQTISNTHDHAWRKESHREFRERKSRRGNP